jgi:hypothetical protein
MKKSFVFMVVIMLAMGSIAASGELTYEEFKQLVKEVVPDGFTLNKSRTSNMRSSFRVEFKGDEKKMEMISVWLFPTTTQFSQMDQKVGEPESYTFKDRPALFTDGDKAGMAGFKLLLNNKKGKLTISHRVFGGTFLKKADFEKMVEKIGLENLEK